MCRYKKTYTGWYAEHLWSGLQKQAGYFLAKNYTYGSISLELRKRTKAEWDLVIDNYVSEKTIDTTDSTLESYIQIPTGSYNDFKLKNIFDLSGNMIEWTTEFADLEDGGYDSISGTYAIMRGGRFTVYGADHSLSWRDGAYDSKTAYVAGGFRVVLYIK